MFLNIEDLQEQENNTQEVVQQVKKPVRLQQRFSLKKSEDQEGGETQQQPKKRTLTRRTNSEIKEPLQDSPTKESTESKQIIEESSQETFQDSQKEDIAAKYRQRQKLLEQQKSLLQQKQRQMYDSQVQQNDGYMRSLGRGESFLKDDGIDYSKLALVLNQQNQSSYEPGTQYNNNDQLPKLNQLTSTYQRNETKPLMEPKPIEQQSTIMMKQRSFHEEEQVIQSVRNEPEEIAFSSDEEQIEDNQQFLKEQEKENELRKELKQQNDKILMEDTSQQKQEEEEVQQIQETQNQKNEPQQNDTTIQEEQKQDPIPQSSISSRSKCAYPKPIDPVIITDMLTFLTSPAPKGGMMQCTIKRDKSGMGQFYPKYHLHLSNGFRYLMSAKKRACNNTSNYLVTMSRNEYDKKSQHYLGKVRSNFMGTEFVLYNKGEDPKKSKNPSKYREQLGLVFYESNILGHKGPRKMKVLIPKLNEKDEPFVYRPVNEKEGILNDYRSMKTENVLEFVNRKPRWNDQVQAFVLNFYGRVDKPSVKNFQLVQEGVAEESILLQFGRVGQELFNLDFQYPISPLQAFQITLTSFDYKIACE